MLKYSSIYRGWRLTTGIAVAPVYVPYATEVTLDEFQLLATSHTGETEFGTHRPNGQVVSNPFPRRIGSARHTGVAVEHGVVPSAITLLISYSASLRAASAAWNAKVRSDSFPAIREENVEL